jgi:hypothetical protein
MIYIVFSIPIWSSVSIVSWEVLVDNNTKELLKMAKERLQKYEVQVTQYPTFRKEFRKFHDPTPTEMKMIQISSLLL